MNAGHSRHVRPSTPDIRSQFILSVVEGLRANGLSHSANIAAGSSGFTLIELVITVAIVAILAAVAVPFGDVAVQRGKEQELRRALREIRDGIDAYKQAFDEGRIQRRAGDSGYPKKIEDLVEGIEDQRNPKKEKIYFLRRLPRDPLASDPTLAPAATWGKRSYASPPDEPREGDDVFDVYSLALGKGINGRPYKEW